MLHDDNNIILLSQEVTRAHRRGHALYYSIFPRSGNGIQKADATF